MRAVHKPTQFKFQFSNAKSFYYQLNQDDPPTEVPFRDNEAIADAASRLDVPQPFLMSVINHQAFLIEQLEEDLTDMALWIEELERKLNRLKSQV